MELLSLVIIDNHQGSNHKNIIVVTFLNINKNKNPLSSQRFQGLVNHRNPLSGKAIKHTFTEWPIVNFSKGRILSLHFLILKQESVLCTKRGWETFIDMTTYYKKRNTSCFCHIRNGGLNGVKYTLNVALRQISCGIKLSLVKKVEKSHVSNSNDIPTMIFSLLEYLNN